MAVAPKTVNVVDIHHLAAVVRNLIDNVLIIDSRSFLEYNTCHVTNAVNVCCSKIVKRRLQQNKISVRELFIHTCHCDVDDSYDVVVYDQGSPDAESLSPDSFIAVLLRKLLPVFVSVNLVQGGFLEFHASYPNLCEDKTRKCAPLTSLSQPCLPIANQGPTRILPFLYLGSQHDALNKESLQNHNITYQLNVSTTCPKPEFIQDTHFMRIPVNDNYSEKLLPYFHQAFQFLDKVREASGCVLVHCLAGISRSATVAIAYVMQHLQMNSDDAYRYVKSKRATISPNFNFLGQLLEYEKQLQKELPIMGKTQIFTAPILKEERVKAKLFSSLGINPTLENLGVDGILQNSDQNNSVGLLTKLKNDSVKDIQRNRSHSCTGDWLSVNEDSVAEIKYRTLTLEQQENYRMSEKMFHRQSSKENACIKEERFEGERWSIKGIPVSSLKELNFTPCQTSNSTGSCSQEFKEQSHSMLIYNDLLGKANSTVSSVSYYAFDAQKNHKHHTYAFCGKGPEENKTELCKSPSCLPETSSATHLSMYYVPTLPTTDLHMETTPCEYDAKEYSRSDSVSTSGLGSESSEYSESLYDNTNVSERDDEYGGIHFDSDDEIGSQDILLCKNVLDDPFSKFYSKSLINFSTSTEVSPLSPSEKHFLEDYPGDIPGKVDSKDCFKIPFCRTVYKSGLESKQILCVQNKALSTVCEKESMSVLSQKQVGKGDGLHRTQSCPGIPDYWLQPPSKLEGSRQGTKFLATGSDAPWLRKTKTTTAEKLKNRYSCSSLDYMDYDSSRSLSLTHDSCPDVLHFGGCQKESESSSSKTPHYHHSVLFNAILT